MIVDLSESPDALIMHLIGGELALGFESGEQMLKASDTLWSPMGAFHIRREGSNARTPVAVYIVPKGRTLASAEK